VFRRNKQQQNTGLRIFVDVPGKVVW